MAAKGQKLTAEQRAKIGEGIHRSYEKARRSWVGSPTHKHCQRCDETKPLHEFSLRKQRLVSGELSIGAHHPCKKCVAKRGKDRRERLKKEGKLKAFEKRQRERRDKDKQRAYVRESKAKRRREEGRPVRGPRKKQALHAGQPLNVQPLIGLLEKELPLLAQARNAANGREEGEFASDGSGALAELSGVSPRRLYSLLHGKQEVVALSTVDKILVGLGLPHMLPILYPEA